MKKVLSTKTLDSDTLAYAQTLQMDVQCMDFIETAAFPFKFEPFASKNFDALVFTSASAVKYFFENKAAAAFVESKKIFALQGKTREELLVRGIQTDISAASAHELASAIIQNKAAKDILHICGNLRLTVMEESLQQAGILYTDLMVYQTGTKAKKAADKFDAILFYSPSGVESFLALNNLDDETVYCCIGNTTAQELKERSNSITIILPEQPSPQSMLTAVSNHFHKS